MSTRSNARPGLWSVRGPMGQRTYWILAAVGLLAPLIAWWALAASGFVSKVFMPGPAQVLQDLSIGYNFARLRIMKVS